MTNVTFAWQNLFDAATLTKSSENPLFPASNLKNRWPTRTWRSANNTGTLTEWVKADLGSPLDVSMFALKNHNLSSSAVARIQGNASDSWSTPSVDVTLSLQAGLLAYFWSSPQTYQWWRYYIVDSAPVTTYLEGGRLWLGPVLVPAINIINAYTKTYNDPSDILPSDGGQIITNQKTRFKTIDLSFENLGSTDVDYFDAMFEDRGQGKELFFTRDQASPLTTTMYCRISAAPKLTHVLMEQLYNLQFSLEELR